MARDKTDKTDLTPVATFATFATLGGRALKYSEAVRRSKKFIKSALGEEWKQSANGEVMLMTYGLKMLRHKTGELLALAETDAESFDALRLGSAYSLERGEELPPEAMVWLVQYLRGEVSRPKANSGRPAEFWLHLHIWVAVGSRVQDGMTATRNDAGPATSACDAVSDALAELGLEPATFHSVKRIWLRFEKSKGSTIETT